MSIDHNRARELQARGDRLRELLENPPPTDIVRSRKWQPRQIGDVYADWIDAVVAAHKEGTE